MIESSAEEVEWDLDSEQIRTAIKERRLMGFYSEWPGLDLMLKLFKDEDTFYQKGVMVSHLWVPEKTAYFTIFADPHYPVVEDGESIPVFDPRISEEAYLEACRNTQRIRVYIIPVVDKETAFERLMKWQCERSEGFTSRDAVLLNEWTGYLPDKASWCVSYFHPSFAEGVVMNPTIINVGLPK